MSLKYPRGYNAPRLNRLQPFGKVSKVQYLVVAGGGGAGSTATGAYVNGGAGGGAGGLLQGLVTITPGTSYTITVGAGGTTSLANNGAQGANSSFGSLVSATGGGFGVGYSGGTAGNGGSGGGGGTSGTGIAGQGFSGGILNYNRVGHVGGGGAGGPGWNDNVYSASSYVGSNGPLGGPGILTSITGKPEWFASGGCGGAGAAATGTAAQLGGGGNSADATGGGTVHIPGSPGMPNTGGGGGGASGNFGAVTVTVAALGGTGGSGIVVIAYPIGYNAPVTLTGSQVYYANGNQIYIWHSTGSVTF